MVFQKKEYGNILQFEKKSTEITDSLIKNIVIQDTDGDGLLDWEETLWATDIHKKDTDGDGTNDGDEIRLGRNPTKPGPDDLLSEEVRAGTGNTAPQNITEVFEDSFRPLYEKLSQTGELDTTNRSELYKAIEENFVENAPSTQKNTLYKPDNLIISVQSSRDDIVEYLQKLMTTSDPYARRHEQNPIEILQEIFETQNTEKTAELIEIAYTYQELVESLLKITVPADVAPIHLSLLNAYSALINATNNMAQIAYDPLRAVAGITEYQRELNNILTAQKKLSELLTQSTAPIN